MKWDVRTWEIATQAETEFLIPFLELLPSGNSSDKSKKSEVIILEF